MKQQDKVIVNTITNEIIMKSVHSCEYCSETLEPADKFCKNCGFNVQQKWIYEKKNNLVIYPPINYSKVPKNLIDKMDFVMEEGKVIKARSMELLHAVPNFVEDLNSLLEDYGFSSAQTMMFGIYDGKIF